MRQLLKGRTILVVEDDYIAALDLKQMIEERGGTVVGPVGQLARAQSLARSEAFDAAILDVKLDGELTLRLADDLIARGVPVILSTGYAAAMLPDRFAKTPRLSKPFTDSSLERVTRRIFGSDPSRG
jgi:two-component system, response regulator PdtaR